jgi:hypothetical protein
MASNPLGDALILGAPGIDGKAVNLPSHGAINAFSDEKHRLASHDDNHDKKVALDPEIKDALSTYGIADRDNEEHIIITGADAAAHLLSLRDDFEPALTFRSIFLASILSAFQAVVYQIYQVFYILESCAGRNPNFSCSSSPRWLIFREPLSFSWLTSWVLLGLNFYLAGISSKLGGELKAMRAECLITSRFCLSSTMVLGALKSMPSQPSQPLQHL